MHYQENVLEAESSEPFETELLYFLTDLFHPADAHDRLQDITVYKAEINLAFNGEWQVVA